jgi:hypothetical protein
MERLTYQPKGEVIQLAEHPKGSMYLTASRLWHREPVNGVVYSFSEFADKGIKKVITPKVK